MGEYGEKTGKYRQKTWRKLGKVCKVVEVRKKMGRRKGEVMEKTERRWWEDWEKKVRSHGED